MRPCPPLVRGQRSPSERSLKRWQIQDLLVRHLRVDPDLTELQHCSPRFTKAGPKHDTAEFVVRQTIPHSGSKLASAGIKDKSASALILSAYHHPHLDMTCYVGSNQQSVLLMNA